MITKIEQLNGQEIGWVKEFIASARGKFDPEDVFHHFKETPGYWDQKRVINILTEHDIIETVVKKNRYLGYRLNLQGVEKFEKQYA